MPYTIRKMPGKSCYRLAKPATKTSKRRVFSKCTSLANAQAQLRLLNAIKYNKSFVPLAYLGKRSGTKRSRGGDTKRSDGKKRSRARTMKKA